MRQFSAIMSRNLPLTARIRAIMRDRTAGVTTIATLALPVVIGAAGLAFDLNRGYQQRVINQRVADMGALAAALAYADASDGSVVEPVAQDIALANGLIGATVTAELVADFPSTGNDAVRVSVTRPLPFSLAAVLGFTGTYDVTASSLASLAGSTPNFAAPCYLALDGSKAAISVTGGASINAPTCSVAAIGEVENKGTLIRGADIISGSDNIELNYGTLDANTLRFAGVLDKPSWNNNVPAPEDWINEPTSLTDPWANDAELLNAYTKLGNYSAPSSIASPSVATGSDFKIKWNGESNNVKPYEVSSGVWVFPTGHYEMRNLTIDGGMNVTFGDGSTITVSGNVNIGGGTTVDFGDSDIVVAGDFDSGSTGVTIGDGALWVGGDAKFQGANSKGDGDVYIVGDLDFWGGSTNVWGEGDHLVGGNVDVGGGADALLGEGDFQAGAGVNMSGDSELALGDGDVVIGPGNANRAIFMSGSARFFMGDGGFSANGDIDTQGGTYIRFPITGNHYINGDLNPKGGVLFGKGRYTINGDFENGTGGTVWPYTSDLNGQTYGDWLEGENVSGFDMVGIDVTFILSGVMKLAGGAKTKLEAPDYDISGAQIADLLISSESSDDANWTGGSVNAFAGTVHFPNAQVKMAGGNETVSGTKCMSVIADTIRVNGGAATGTACNRMDEAISGGGSGSTASIRLVG